MRRVRKTRTRDRSGQGLTEYAILIATVSLGLILLLGSFRNALGNVFRNSRNTLQNNSTRRSRAGHQWRRREQQRQQQQR